MVVVAILVLLLSFVSLLSFLGTEENTNDAWILVCIVVLMTLLAGLRPIGLDADSDTYQAYFFTPDTSEGVEETYLILCRLLLPYFDTVRPIFIIYALISVPLMAYSLYRLTKNHLLTFTVWIGHYYILHDMTQIRLGLALSIVFWGLYYLKSGTKAIYVVSVLIASCFHVSVALFLLLAFVGNEDLSKWWKIALVVVPSFCYLIGLLHVDLIPMLPFEYVQDKINAYETMRDLGVMGESINLLKPVYLIRLMAYYLLLWKNDLLKEHFAFYNIGLKMLALSFVLFTLLSSIPAISYRLFDLFGVIEILMIPTLAYAFKPSAVGKCFVILFSFAYLYSMISTFNLN